MPQLKSVPDVTCRKGPPGVPWLTGGLPQHASSPLPAIAHAWVSPVLICVNPAPAAGVDCFCAFAPQQRIVPSGRRPHANREPALIYVSLSRGGVACPSPLKPQQPAVPSFRRPQEK